MLIKIQKQIEKFTNLNKKNLFTFIQKNAQFEMAFINIPNIYQYLNTGIFDK